MSRIASTFAELRARNEKALIGFITAGDTFPDDTATLIVTLAEAGCDIVELGIPFSDPLLDGPTIQAATQRALDAGMTPKKVLDIVRQVRERSEVPIVLMGAYNPVMQYAPDRGGLSAFAQDAVVAGADGAILSDLTPEEAGEWKQAADAAGLDTIFLLAPTSTPARMALVAKLSKGFIYCMARSGVTGARSDVPEYLPPLIASIREHVGDIPLGIGFGISQPAHVAAIAQYADGIVVGAALVDTIHKAKVAGADKAGLLVAATEFIRPLKAATKPLPSSC